MPKPAAAERRPRKSQVTPDTTACSASSASRMRLPWQFCRRPRHCPMHCTKPLAALVGASLLPIQPVFAHGFAGPHMFISTLLIDDPNVADEASVPTFMWLPQPTDSGPAPGLYSLGFGFDKRITENF